MVKEQKKALVPKLRFPEFQKGEGWNYALLGKLFSERQEAGFKDLPLLSLMDKEGIIPQEETNRKNNSSADKSKYLRVVPGDIAYNTMRMWEGRSAFVGLEGLVSPAYTVCAPTEQTNSLFFSYYFRTAPLIALFRRYSQGLVKDTLNLKYEAFARIEIPYPVKEDEQQKLADCLSSLDELIAAQDRKVEALKTYKRGLMQQLFPREGETLPRLRFPEFRDAPEWSEETLGKHVDIWSGNSPSTFALSSSGIYPYVKVEDLNNCTKYQTTGREFCDDARGVVPKHSLLFPKRGAAIELNKIRITKSQIQIDTNLMAITPKEGLIVEFLLYCISNVGLAHIADTSTIPQINNKHIIPFVIRFPSVVEQQQIADALSAIDVLITSEVEKLDSFKTHKMGLMQQLFPSLEEA